MKRILATILACSFAYGQGSRPVEPEFKIISYKPVSEHTHQFVITDGFTWELEASTDMKNWSVVWSPFTKVVNEDGTATYTYTRLDKDREFFRYKLIDPNARAVLVNVIESNILGLVNDIDPTVDDNRKLFLQYDGPDNLVRNSFNFMHRLKGVTGLVAWNSKSAGSGKWIGGAAVTPFHVICTAHAPYQEGDTVYFVTRNNKVVARKIWAVQGAWGDSEEADYVMCLLDNPLPPTIEPLQMMPSDSHRYISDQTSLLAFKDIPYVWVNQHEDVVIGTIKRIHFKRYDDPTPDVFSRYGHSEYHVAYGETPYPELEPWRYDAVPGDSGSVIMFVLDNRLVLAGHYSRPSAGSWFGQLRNINDFNRMIELLDERAGFNTYEKIDQVDLSRKYVDLKE